jgi:uncharacterized protein YdcH (DUF465 family)
MADPSPEAPLERAKVHRERLAEAADALERAITGPAGNETVWRDATRDALDEVRSALGAHVEEVESPDGVFAEIMERSPRLAHAIERLRAEHTKLDQAVARVDASLGSEEATVEDVRESTLVLLADITRHRHRGADLIWDSYDFDIGVGD